MSVPFISVVTNKSTKVERESNSNQPKVKENNVNMTNDIQIFVKLSMVLPHNINQREEYNPE